LLVLAPTCAPFGHLHAPPFFFHKKNSSCLQERTGRRLSISAVCVKVSSSSCVLIGKAPLCLFLLLFVLYMFLNHPLLSAAVVLFAVLLFF
jgi:hypothetical protein